VEKKNKKKEIKIIDFKKTIANNKNGFKEISDCIEEHKIKVYFEFAL
jgi:hypothetical protein